MQAMKEAVQVRLETKEGAILKGRDLLNHEEVEGSGLSLPFQGVRLIKLSRH